MHPGHRTDLIEWVYLNKDCLAQHEMIAAGVFADCLKDVLNQPVTTLSCPRYGGHREMEKMIRENKIDLFLCFGNPGKTSPEFPGAGRLIDAATEHDIMTGCNQQTISVLTTYLKSITIEKLTGNSVSKIASLRLNDIHPEIMPMTATA